MANRTIFYISYGWTLVSSHAPINHFKVVKSVVRVFGYDLFLRGVLYASHD